MKIEYMENVDSGRILLFDKNIVDSRSAWVGRPEMNKKKPAAPEAKPKPDPNPVVEMDSFTEAMLMTDPGELDTFAFQEMGIKLDGRMVIEKMKKVLEREYAKQQAAKEE